MSTDLFEELITNIEKYSALELMVIKDMIEAGYDPLNKDEIDLYWSEYINAKETV